MKFCFITSVFHLDDFAIKSNYHLTLVHLFELYPDYYLPFYKERALLGDYVILDNSYFELGKSATIDRLLKVLKKMNFSEVIIPESRYLNEYEKSINYSTKRLSEINWKGKVQAVLKGNTLEEYLKCYEFFINNSNIDVIGVPIEMSKVLTRTDFFNILEQKGLFYNKKEYHLLGLEFPEELKELKKIVRSCDSSIPFWQGVYGIKLYKGKFLYKKIKDKLDFTYKLEYKKQYEIINYNIKQIRKAIK